MHSLLENYLSDMAAHLGPLPTKRRKEELREMQAHLENALLVNREQGQAEDEAARETLAQFGPSAVLGAETVAAWRRGVVLNRRSFWGAAACAYGLLLLVIFLLVSLQTACLRHAANSHLSVSAGIVLVLLGPTLSLLYGIIAGAVFRHRAVVVVALALGVRLVWGIGSSFYQAALGGHAVGFPPNFILPCILQEAVDVSFAFLGAWAGSRWRERQARLARS